MESVLKEEDYYQTFYRFVKTFSGTLNKYFVLIFFSSYY